jgi:RimJ/RimL family protein N-acetyltransferase
MGDIPTIQTDRLLLRGFIHDDFDSYAAIWADPDVVRHIGAKPISKQNCWQGFLRNIGHWHLLNFGQWAIVDRAGGDYIGQAGFFNGLRELGDDFDRHPEAGWVLSPQMHGRGLGHEVATAIHQWADSHICGATVCMIEPTHTASLAIATAQGYRPLRLVDVLGQVLLLRRTGPSAPPFCSAHSPIKRTCVRGD